MHFFGQITWVEHVEVDETGVPTMYRPLVNSGLAFGAKRWVAALDRQSERFATSIATTIPTGDLRGTSLLFISLFFPFSLSLPLI